MVTFTHSESGTSEDAWAFARDTSSRDHPPEALPVGELERLIVIAAHPDDETLGAGGLIARAGHQGIPVTVVVLTCGEASHPHSPTHNNARLAKVRRAEVTAAVRALNPAATIIQGDLPDGALGGHREAAARFVTAALGPARGPGTWLVSPWHADGHPDHTVAAEATRAVARTAGVRVFQYPIWAWHWTDPAEPAWPVDDERTLDLTPEEWERKSHAMALHDSQMRPLSPLPGDEPIITADMAAHFTRHYETFIDVTFNDVKFNDVTFIDVTFIDVSAVPPALGAQSLTRPFFDRFYGTRRDPWGFESRWYEQRKRDLTLAALPRPHFGAALELGCSIGVLTERLADRCDTVLAIDIAEQPLHVARARLAGRPGVRFARRTLPAEWPEGRFDLIVLSEVGYYLSADELRDLVQRCRNSLSTDGVLVACHWLHPVPEYPLTGEQVHQELGRVPGLDRTVHHRERDFVLDVFETAPARSVAQREGLTP